MKRVPRIVRGAVFILFHLFEGHGKLATAAMMYGDQVWDERRKADATQKKARRYLVTVIVVVRLVVILCPR